MALTASKTVVAARAAIGMKATIAKHFITHRLRDAGALATLTRSPKH